MLIYYKLPCKDFRVFHMYEKNDLKVKAKEFINKFSVILGFKSEVIKENEPKKNLKGVNPVLEKKSTGTLQPESPSQNKTVISIQSIQNITESEKEFIEKNEVNELKIKADIFVDKIIPTQKEHRILLHSKKGQELKLHEILNIPPEILKLKGTKTISKHTNVIQENVHETTFEDLKPKLNSLKVRKTNKPNFLIEEEKSSFLGIKAGETKRGDVINIMNQHSNHDFSGNNESFWDYDDLSIKIHFNTNDIVDIIEFESDFKGNTQKGLKNGDSMEYAISIYGSPLKRTERELIWENFKTHSNKTYITKIILFNRNAISDNDKILLTRDFKIYSEKNLTGIIVSGTLKSVLAGANNKTQVINFMKEFSNITFSPETESLELYYSDADIKFIFDDKQILRDIEFHENFKGSCIKGLKIGDSRETAMNMYDEADLINDSYAVWNNLKVYFSKNNIVSLMEVRS